MELGIRSIEVADLDGAFRIMKQLRTAHTLNSFRSHVISQYRSGYHLYGVFENDNLFGLVGFRPVKTLARGSFVHVDDLVVDKAHRKKQIGRTLMDFILNYAKSAGYTKVFLDARPEAVGFYKELGYIFHSSPSMKIVAERA